jgi:signal transduction histidine kinase
VDYNLKDDQRFGELAQSVNNMALELNQLEGMRQEFISNVSHEIQSPLTSIRGFAQALRNDQLSNEERLHYLSIIETESRRLSNLSDNLLELASLEAKNMKFEPKSYRLDKQLRDVILASEPQWMDKQIDLEIFLDEIDIHGDEDLLSQVWTNLIHNSIKFTPEAGRVRLDLHRKGEQIEVKISDTGIGIEEEDKAHIFERFYKADLSRERSQGGSGLGLSISKKIIEMHQGTITVESRLGFGAAFIVSLPIG